MSINCGSFSIDGEPAPVGTVVAVRGENIFNSTLTLDVQGMWGGAGPFANRLNVFPVRGVTVPYGAPVYFYIGENKLNVKHASDIVWADHIEYVPGGVANIELNYTMVEPDGLCGDETEQPCDTLLDDVVETITDTTTMPPMPVPIYNGCGRIIGVKICGADGNCTYQMFGYSI
jgi:hypothetical protein